MKIYVHTTSGGKTLFDLISDLQTKTIFVTVVELLQMNGLDELSIRPLVKTTRPPLWEIRVDRNGKFVRFHYFVDSDGCINICNVVEKKKNKAQQKDLDTSLKRKKNMVKGINRVEV